MWTIQKKNFITDYYCCMSSPNLAAADKQRRTIVVLSYLQVHATSCRADMLQVKAGSKAEALGVRPGDIVHSINGQSTNKLTLSDTLSLVYGDNSRLTLQLSTYVTARVASSSLPPPPSPLLTALLLSQPFACTSDC